MTLATGLALAAAAVLACGSAGQRDASSPAYVLKQVASRLAEPVYVTAAPGEPGRLYIVFRGGTVRVLAKGRLESARFLDLRSRVQAYGEMASSRSRSIRGTRPAGWSTPPSTTRASSGP